MLKTALILLSLSLFCINDLPKSLKKGKIHTWIKSKDIAATKWTKTLREASFSNSVSLVKSFFKNAVSYYFWIFIVPIIIFGVLDIEKTNSFKIGILEIMGLSLLLIMILSSDDKYRNYYNSHKKGFYMLLFLQIFEMLLSFLFNIDIFRNLSYIMMFDFGSNNIFFQFYVMFYTFFWTGLFIFSIFVVLPVLFTDFLTFIMKVTSFIIEKYFCSAFKFIGFALKFLIISGAIIS